MSTGFSDFQGNKMNDIDVVYTLWSNLHKTDGMDVGQVGFHKQVNHCSQLCWSEDEFLATEIWILSIKFGVEVDCNFAVNL